VLSDIEAMAPAHFPAPPNPFPAEMLAVAAFVALAPAVKEACIHTNVDSGARSAVSFIGLHLFIAGLRPHLREELMKAPPVTLYAAFQGAVALEKIHMEPRKSNGGVHEVDEDGDVDEVDQEGEDAEIEALSAKLKALKKKKNGGRNGQGKRRYPQNQQQQQQQKTPSSTEEKDRCRFCKKTGHKQASCFARIKAGAAMVDRNGKPFTSQGVHQITGQQMQQQQQQHQAMYSNPPPSYNPFTHMQGEQSAGHGWAGMGEGENSLN